MRSSRKGGRRWKRRRNPQPDSSRSLEKLVVSRKRTGKFPVLFSFTATCLAIPQSCFHQRIRRRRPMSVFRSPERCTGSRRFSRWPKPIKQPHLGIACAPISRPSTARSNPAEGAASRETGQYHPRMRRLHLQSALLTLQQIVSHRHAARLRSNCWHKLPPLPLPE